MEELFYFNIGLLAIAFVLAGPIALVMLLIQRGRVGELEGRIARLERIGPETDAQPLSRARQPDAPPAPAQVIPPPDTRSAVSEPVPTEPAARPISVPPVQPTQPPQLPATPRPSIEERFGTRWTVWIGGVALAFGAALLVRYSVEQGFFGPGVRTASAFLLALVLLGTGEWLRRRLREAGAVPARWPDVPATVTAAGIVALFGAIYASYALYGFIGPQLAFIGLAATGLAAMVAALLHGPALAGMGLVGALTTPLLAGEGGSPWPLVIYLPAVAATAYAFAWIKDWRALGVAAAIGVALWAALLTIFAADASAAPAALVHAMVQAALATYVFAILPYRTIEDRRPSRFAFTMLTGIMLMLLLVLNGAVTVGFGAIWIMTAIAAIALPAVAALLAPASAVGLVMAGLALSAIIVVWPPELDPDWVTLPAWPDTQDPTTFLTLASLSALGIAAAGAIRLLGGARLAWVTALTYAAGATLSPLAALTLSYLRFSGGEISPSFAAAAGALALAMTVSAAAFRRECDMTPSPVLRLGLGAFASAAIASLSLGLVFATSGGSLTVAMALAALGTAAIARHLDIPALRWCVAGLGAVVALRLAHDPTIVGADLGRSPILNWLLVGYGVPALAFAAASRLLRLPGRKPDAPVLVTEALGIVLAAFLVFFEIRHALHGGDIYAAGTSLVEQGLLSLSWLVFAILLVRMNGVFRSPVIRIASLVFGALALVQTLLGLVFIANPILTGEPVAGGLIVNDITLAYGLPAAAALALAWTARASRPRWYVLGAGGLGLFLAVLGLSLLIRHAFQGSDLGFDRATSQAEWYAYSAGWLLLGLVLLGYGVLRGSLMARLASAGLVVISIVKVFLFDLAGLDGPLRALSFLGLGAVLIGIGLVYQRFVFVPPRRPAAGEG